MEGRQTVLTVGFATNYTSDFGQRTTSLCLSFFQDLHQSSVGLPSPHPHPLPLRNKVGWSWELPLCHLRVRLGFYLGVIWRLGAELPALHQLLPSDSLASLWLRKPGPCLLRDAPEPVAALTLIPLLPIQPCCLGLPVKDSALLWISGAGTVRRGRKFIL